MGLSLLNTSLNNRCLCLRYHVPAERFVPIVSPDDGYDGHYDRCDDAYSSRKEAAALYSRASAIVDAMPSSAAALSRAYATATLRPSNRCCTGPLYSGGGSGGVGGSGGGGSGGCGYQYGTVGRSRSPRDLSPSGLVRQQAVHLSSTGSPPKGPSNNNNNNNNSGNNNINNNNNACLLQYDVHSANTLPRCSSANVVCAGQNHYDEPVVTGYGGSHAAARRISSSCIRESTALACCSTAAYSGYATLSGVKSAAAATSTASATATSTPSAVAAAVAAAAAAAATTSTPSTTTHSSGSGSGGGNNNNAHCPPAQPNNASW